MTESKITQALDRLSLQIRKLSEELSELKSEVKRLHHAIDKATGETKHPAKTYEARVSAFKAYQEGTSDA